MMLYDPHSDPIDSFRGEHRFLSNFYRVEVRIDLEYYPSVEHAYQAMKSNSPGVRERIRLCATPGDAKRMGRRLDIRSDWESVKLSVMEDLLGQKFQVWNFREGIIQTYPRQLIEGNTWGDRYWGKCNGEGENHLGKLLMKIRLELRGSHEEMKKMGGGW